MPPAPVESTAVAAPLEVLPPDDLASDELAVWNREAPLATQQGTLIAATASAFRELCELEALKNQMLVEIKKELTVTEVGQNGSHERANPLLTHYRGAVQRLATFRKDFKLGPFGKELFTPQTAQEQPKPQKRSYW